MNLRNFRRLALLTALACAGAGCSADTVPVEVRIIRPNLSGSGPDPLDGVTHVRVRVLDAARNTLQQTVAAAEAKSATLEGLPTKVALRIDVTGFAGAPPNGQRVSYGLSAGFELPDLDGAPSTAVPVVLRAIGRLSPMVRSDDPTSRVELGQARAGHTATLLDDGRVLIAGGFDADATDVTHRAYRESTELLDPVTGTVTAGAPMEYAGRTTARAFHSATKTAEGNVLIVGGEAVELGVLKTVPSALVFDPRLGQGRGGWQQPPALKRVRSRHTATLEVNGRVVLIGGIDHTVSPAAYVDLAEWYDPGTGRFVLQSGGAPLMRSGHAALSLLEGQYIGIAGGSLSTPTGPELAGASSGIQFFRYDLASDGLVPLLGLTLRVPRSWAAVAELGASKFAILGGFTGFDPARPHDLFPAEPYADSDVLRMLPAPERLDGPWLEVPRGHLCAVTLPDRSVLAAGGRTLGSSGAPEATAATSLLSDTGDGLRAQRVENLLEARYLHTCTLLQDGSVLIAGGLSERAGSMRGLSSLEIYQAPPRD